MKIIILFCFIFASQLAFSAPDTSLYLDELGSASSDYTVNDSQNNYNGVAHSAPSIGSGLGKICSATDLRANGTADYITLNKNSLDGANDFTISIWHKGNSGAGRSLISGARSGQHNAILWWFGSATSVSLNINGTSGGGITIPSISDNKWHHFVWRRVGSTNCMFTDGVQRGCKTKAATGVALSIQSLILGQEQDSVGGAFDPNQDWEGIVDELLIFKSGLSNTQITSIYNNQKNFKTWDNQVRNCPTPPLDNNYSDYHFDEATLNGTANEITDHHGIYNGTGHSVTTTPGKVCNGLDLRTNSNTDYAVLGAGALDGVDDFTISVWHKGAVGSDSNALLSGAGPGSLDNEGLLWFTTSTRFVGHIRDKSMGGVITNNISDNNWHHFAWVRKGTESCFYMDAVYKGCQSLYNSERLTIASLILGQDQDNVGGGFDVNQDWEGIIDELLIFRRAFNSSQISSIYNNQNMGKNWDGGVRNCPQPSMSLKKTSTVLSDPINLTSNPKRIPGSIVRYTITATNTSAIYAEGIVTKDNLHNQIVTLGKINWQGNLRVKSPNINGGVWTNLTDAGGDDQGEFTNNEVIVNCGNINNAAPCIVTYEVEIQ